MFENIEDTFKANNFWLFIGRKNLYRNAVQEVYDKNSKFSTFVPSKSTIKVQLRLSKDGQELNIVQFYWDAVSSTVLMKNFCNV